MTTSIIGPFSLLGRALYAGQPGAATAPWVESRRAARIQRGRAEPDQDALDRPRAAWTSSAPSPMRELSYRRATLEDIALVAAAVLEAERSGTPLSLYERVFDLGQGEVE